MRTFTIITTHNTVDIFKNIIDKLPVNSDDGIYVFSGYEIKDKRQNIKYIDIPSDILDYESKIKNFVSKYFIDNNVKGFLHVFEETAEIQENYAKFLDPIEKMMNVFNLNVWFNTVCDECNYNFEKYISRFNIHIDDSELAKKYDTTISWFSNANTKYIIYNLDKVTFDEMKFNESFKIAMYYIIDFLARRSANNLGFMNCYPSVPEEKGILKSNKTDFKVDYDIRKQMIEEDKIFKSLNLNINPESNIDKIMEFMQEKINALKTSAE